MTRFTSFVLPFSFLSLFGCGSAEELSNQMGEGPAAPSLTETSNSAKQVPPRGWSALVSKESTRGTADKISSLKPTLELSLVPKESTESYLPVSFSHNGPYFPSECVNLGATYRGPAYAVRMRVTGPRGAEVHKFNYHESCAAKGAREWKDPQTWIIPASGVLEYDYTDFDPVSCTTNLLGRWRSYVVVEGVRSENSYITYYQSACGIFGSCSAAMSLCPPSGPNNG